MSLQYWGITDPGCVRAQNQDVYQLKQLDRNSMICVVCDGMGGAKSGNIASTLAADVFVEQICQNWKPEIQQDQIEEMLVNAAKLANFTVFDQAQQLEEFSGMGTTLVAALIANGEATVINVGDSRAYKLDRNGIVQITRDHSLVQMMLDKGELTPEQAKRYPGKNFITRAIGTEASLNSDVFHLVLERGDCLLLCSDGLTNVVDEQEILFEVVHGVNKQYCCKRLLEVAINRGAPDNVTCALVQI